MNRGGAPPQGRLSPAQARDQELQIMQFKEMQAFVTRTVKTCFSECVNDFNSAKMTDSEQGCLDACIRRTMNVQTELDSLFPQIDSKFKDQQ
ncbi:hypothetical protein FGO68_gene12970 [Halteria grandinella]|uniref:Mitochondrial import inner membrane translocase subunit n=1 Tax=Halteria grandinella TaxID=5974 RepID=A0A8J8NBC0_HALGN|nr:hypothetical protein FGO68_gene12970 [Halteria grandinella]